MHRAVGFAEVMRAVQFRKDVAGNEQSWRDGRHQIGKL